MTQTLYREIDRLRQDIAASAQQMLSAKTRDPANDSFHNARYKLYEIASHEVAAGTYRELVEDDYIQELAAQVFPVSCEAGIYEECAIAGALLEMPNLTFGHIYRNYYGKVYEALMNDELAFLERHPDIDVQQEHVTYIGGGAMPIPAMLLAHKIGCRVTVVDPDERSCTLARQLIGKVDLDHLVSVVQSKGESYDYSQSGLIFIANWIPEKQQIFAQIGRFNNIRYCIFRSAAEQTLSFVINDQIRLCDVCDHGLELQHKTEKRPGLSLVSLIFSLKKSCRMPCEKKVNCKKNKQSRVIDSMTDLVGNTPMLRLRPEKTGLQNIDLYAKLEHLNPFGSIKDRTALAMLKPHIGKLKATDKDVLELSSGNAARGLQAIASLYGVQLETVSNRIRVEEMRRMLLMQGAKITPITEVESCDAYGALNFVDQKAADNTSAYYYTDQYRNPVNDGTHYSETGREILEDLENVDVFIGSVGTAGSTVGISDRLRENNADLQVVGAISDKDDFIPGLRHKDEIFDVGPFDESLYDEIMAISTDEAIDGILSLIRDYGVMAGPSSGATYQAGLKYLRKLDSACTQRKTAVFTVCDSVEMYFSWIAERRPALFQ